jgi:DNA-binding response OmpR family regulator
LLKDSAAIEGVYKRVLLEAGLAPIVLGSERLDAVLVGMRRISTAVVDVDIRESVGLRSIRRIRHFKPDMGIIAMSAYFRKIPDFAEEVRKAGATVCLSTPVEMNAVVAEIRAVIRA